MSRLIDIGVDTAVLAELQGHVELQSWLRIVAAAVFFYDFLITIPSEWRLYYRQPSILRPSYACVFFFLARYIGLAAVIAPTAIFFSNLTLAQCIVFNPLVGALRSILSTVTNVILLGRTWAIWGRNRNVALFMVVALVPTTVFSYAYLFDQKPIVQNGSCTAVSSSEVFTQKWLFAMVNMIFDILACNLCTVKLILNIKREKGISGVSKILLQDGLGYFVIVMVGHVLNLAFLKSPAPSKQTAFLTFNVALQSILSQRIITALYERTILKDASSHQPSSRSKSRSKSRAPRVPPPPATGASPFNYKRSFAENDDIELGVKTMPISIDVHVEKTIARDIDTIEEDGPILPFGWLNVMLCFGIVAYAFEMRYPAVGF